MSKDKQRVLARSVYVDPHDLLDSHDFEQVKTELDVLESQCNYEQGEEVKFRVEYGCEYTDVYMDVFRVETDAEYDKRMAKNAKAKEKARLAREKKKEKARQVLLATEEAERAEYARLMKKYGNFGSDS